MIATLRKSLAVLALLAVASPAAAQWTRVPGVPVTHVFAVIANDDTLAAGADTAVYVSTDAGASWKRSSKPVAGVLAIQSLLLRGGRLYVGTAGQGVFTSDDLGDTWQAFNQGLVGGFLDTQLDVSDLVVRGDSLYAATLGAGVYVRTLAGPGTWSHFGEEFEPNQASNVNALAVGGTRLLAAAGGNGSVFFRDPGDPDWTISWLNNVGLSPGRQAESELWTGSGWIVGAGAELFRSVLGQEPWTPSGPGLAGLHHTAFALRGGRVFAAFDVINGAVIEHSGDNGATWEELDGLPAVFVYKMAFVGDELFAGRTDGLWRRSTATVSVPGEVATSGLRFALAGAQPVRDQVNFRFELPQAGDATIEVFDITGRRASERVSGSYAAGSHELSWDARALAPGVYEARLSALGKQDVVRLVRVR